LGCRGAGTAPDLPHIAHAEPASSAQKPLPWEILARAQKFEARKQYNQAVVAYEEYLALRPANDTARVALGRIKLAQKRFGEAQAAFEQVLSTDASNREARRGLADALYLNGQAALALPHYQALYAETKDPGIADRIAKITAGQEAPATEPVEPSGPSGQAEPSEPSDIPPPPNSPEGLLAHARELEAAKQYRDATEAYRKYLLVRPDDTEARHSLAHVLSLQGHLEEAVAIYQEMVAKNPSDLAAALAVAKILTWQKKAGAARSYYERALTIDPGNLEAKRGLADIMYWSGEDRQALRYYEEFYAVTQNPEVGQRIQEIRGERLYPPRAPVGRVQPETILPFRDYVKMGFGYYGYDNTSDRLYDRILPEKNGLLELAKSVDKYTVIARAQLINRFGREDIPFGLDIYGPAWHKAWWRMNFSFAGSPTFVPNVDLAGELFQGLGDLHPSLASVEASFGWRHLFFMYHGFTTPPLFLPAQEIDVLTPSLNFYLPHKLWLTETVIYVVQHGSLTFSTRLTWRPTDRLELFASGAFGTTGERIMAIQDVMQAKTQSYQAGVTFPFSEDWSGELTALYEDRGFLWTRQGANFNMIRHF
jgi:YaiO family outer membrane protein